MFGLSGSGKSTLTHAKHDGKYGVTVLHDDAFIINSDTCASIALEPTYFDKTADYPTGCEDNKYLLTAQNCSATLDEDGKVVLAVSYTHLGSVCQRPVFAGVQREDQPGEDLVCLLYTSRCV